MKLKLKGSAGFDHKELQKHFGGLPVEGKSVEVEAVGAFRNTDGYTIVVFKDPRCKNPKNAGNLKLEVSRFEFTDTQRAWLASELRSTTNGLCETEAEATLRKALRRLEREMDNEPIKPPRPTNVTSAVSTAHRPTAPGATA